LLTHDTHILRGDAAPLTEQTGRQILALERLPSVDPQLIRDMDARGV